MKNKKNLFIGGGIAAVVVVVIIGVVFFMNKTSGADVMEKYTAFINDGKYDEMYAMLSKDAKKDISKKDFITRNKNIYTGIEATKIKLSDIKEEEGTVSYTMSMNSLAGEFSFQNKVSFHKEDGEYKLDWNDSFIFPELTRDSYVSLITDYGKRGDIVDRNDKILATQADIMQIGIVAKGNEDQEATSQVLSERIGISLESIEEKLNASWVEADMFVPIKNMAYDQDLYDDLSAISGVQVNILKDEGRSYPYGEKCAHITGYVQSISAEELEEHEGEGYTEESLIGKTGIEKIYEKDLKASVGYIIEIQNSNREHIKTMAKKAHKDGKRVKLTIDIDLQQKLYDEISNDAGCVSAMNFQTGEVLALVSTPSYDPNELAYGISNERWKEITSNELNPLQTRFINTFAPGSTFKTISGAIALEKGIIDNDTDLGKEVNWLWQLDESWGDYYIPTQTQYDEPSNLLNALKYSDNIYFAKLATQLGSDYAKGLNAFGFNDTLPFDFSLEKSTYGKNLKNSVTLATTGFGQGQLQVNPLHLMTMYSAFLNEGNMIQPYLLYDEGKSSYYKENVISAQTAAILKNDLIETASHNAPVVNQTIGGKTGTAEVGDEQLGWMVAFSEEGTQPLLVSVMIENAKAKNGSVYVIPIIQDIFTNVQ